MNLKYDFLVASTFAFKFNVLYRYDEVLAAAERRMEALKAEWEATRAPLVGLALLGGVRLVTWNIPSVIN